MRILTYSDFSGRVGRPFDVSVQGGKLPLTLDAAQELPGNFRNGGSFRLEFRGPPQPVLPQAIYPMQQGSDTFEVFIVPIGADPRGMRYEALFF